MKKIISCFLLLVVAIIIPFSSCTVNSDGDITSAEETPASPESQNDETTDEANFTLPLDPDRIDLPSYSELCAIRPGMTMKMVYEAVGSPQRIQTLQWDSDSELPQLYPNDTIYYVYDSAEGGSVYFYFESRSSDFNKVLVDMIAEDVLGLYEKFFDLKKEFKPTKSDMEQVCLGMPFDLVLETIGKPHGWVDDSRTSYCFKWTTVEGDSYMITFDLASDMGTSIDTTPPKYHHYYTKVSKGPSWIILGSEEVDTEYWERYYDLLQTHKPTEADIFTLRQGMPIGEVIERIGKPHKKGPYSGPTSLLWYTPEGYTCVIVVLTPHDVPKELLPIDTFGKLMQCGVAAEITFPFTFGNNSLPSPSDYDPEPDSYDRFMDPGKAHRPTDEEINSITEGMTYKEVVDRIGKPHRPGFAPIPTLKWYTSNETYITVEFECSLDAPSDYPYTVEELIKYGVVKDAIVRELPSASTDETETEASSEPSETTTPPEPEPEPIPEPETVPVSEW